jgi:adenine specific DNA methylase Mod
MPNNFLIQSDDLTGLSYLLNEQNLKGKIDLVYIDPQYPTEKNAEMLDLIVKTSSNEVSIVMDCFYGSRTTSKASQINNRLWIGIDPSEFARKATQEN